MININLINEELLEEFVSKFALTLIGQDKYTGKATSLTDEIGSIYKMVGLAEASTVNYYNSRQAYSMVERDDISSYKSHKWLDAGKKILFLNAICKKNLGGYFVTQHLATESVSDMMDVAMAFTDALDEISSRYEG